MKFRDISEYLKNPKKKSLTLLGIYVVFFIIVFILINMGSSSDNYINYTEENESDIENIESEKNNDILNYKYIYKIYDDENLFEINGKYNNDVNTFTYNGFDYIKDDEIIYLDNVPVEFDFNIYSYEEIKLLIENSDSETKYKNSDRIIYNININKYFELLNEISNCNYIDCSNIFISITIQENKFINSVIIDLSDYYGYRYIIEIEYTIID